jgi:WD40 repeat protein
VLILATGLVVAAVLAVATLVFAQQSNQNATLATQREAQASANADRADQLAQQQHSGALTAQSKQLGSQADAIVSRSGDPELAALLALNGLASDYTTDADVGLQRAQRMLSPITISAGGPVTGLAVEPDGKSLISTVGNDIVSWNLSDRSQLAKLAMTGSAVNPTDSQTLELSSDGALLRVNGGMYDAAPPSALDVACASLDGPLSPDGQWVYGSGSSSSGTQIVRDSTRDCHEEPVVQLDIDRYVDLAVSPDGKTIALLEPASNGWLLHVVHTATSTDAFTPASVPAGTLVFSPDGTRLGIAGDDGTVRIYDVASGRVTAAFTPGPVLRARFSADGSQILTSGSDGTVRIWDAATGSEVRRYSLSAAIEDAVFSPDGSEVYAASLDGTIRGWPATLATEPATYSEGSEIVSLAFSADGRFLAIGSSTGIQVRDLETGQTSLDLALPGTLRVAISPDGRSVLVSTTDGPTLVDVATGTSHPLLDQIGVFNSAAAFTANGREVLAPEMGSVFALWDASTGDETRMVGRGTVATMTPDGSEVAEWWQGSDHVIDASTGNTIAVISQRSDDSRDKDLALSPDGTHLFTADADNIVRMWNAHTGQLIKQFAGHDGFVRSVQVTPDGSSLVTASEDGTARLWDIESGTVAREFPSHDGTIATTATVSPDGRTIALGSVDGTVELTPLSLPTVEAQVCQRLTRDLTPSERTSFGIQGSAATCP